MSSSGTPSPTQYAAYGNFPPDSAVATVAIVGPIAIASALGAGSASAGPMTEMLVASEKALFTALCNEKYRLQNIGIRWDIADVMEVVTRCLKEQCPDETILLNINQSGDKAWFEWYPTQALADEFSSQRLLCIKLKTAKGWEAADVTKIEGRQS